MTARTRTGNTHKWRPYHLRTKTTSIFQWTKRGSVSIRYTFLFLLFIQLSLPAQISHIQIENITFPNGQQLPDVRTITQDSTGLIWLYTYASSALYTYDGRTLAKLPASGPGYQLPEAFTFFARPGDSVFYITPTALDTVLIFDPIRRVISGRMSSGKRMTRISVNAQGAMWVHDWFGAQAEHQIFSISTGTNFTPIDTIPARWYYDVWGIRSDHYYLKMKDRVYEFDEHGRYDDYPFYPKGPDPMSPSCVADAENTFWAVYNPNRLVDRFSIYYHKPGMDQFALLPKQETITRGGKFGKTYFDGQDIWYRGDPFRLYRRDAAKDEFEDLTDLVLQQSNDYPFYNSPVYTIFRDRSDQIWISSLAGVVKMSLEEKIFQYYSVDNAVNENCLQGSCAIRGITEDEQGHIYFSHEQGIVKLDPATGQMQSLPLNLSVKSILPHNLEYYQGKLYWNEHEIDLADGRHHSYFPGTGNDNMARAIDRAQNRTWMAVHQAPADFDFHYGDLNSDTMTRGTLPGPNISTANANDEIRRLHYSPATRRLFIGTMIKGLAELSTAGEALASNICCQGLHDLYEDDDQQLWIGSYENGLAKIDLHTGQLTQSPYRFSPAIGSFQNVFRILPEGQDYLWLITDQGVLRLHKSSGRLSHFPMFPSLAKMGFFRLPAFVSSDGTFYVGAIDGGVYAFRPEKVAASSRLNERFPVALTSYSRYNDRRDTTFTQQDRLGELQEIRLTHRDRSFNLEFFVPDFRNTSQNLYTHLLEGYDREWSVPTNFNQLQYQNLPPGTYTLRIRGGSMEEYFSTSERSFQVVVLQAWYKTGWAIAAYLLVLTGLIYLLIRYQTQRQLEKAEAVRIKDLDALKTTFYTNITHEFRTPLTVIMGLIDHIRGYDPERQIIRRNSKNLLRLVNQLLDLSKMDAGNMKLNLAQGDIIVYLRYLTESFHSAATEKQIDLRFETPLEELIMDFDEIKIQHILYNLLSNALKFTPAGGSISVFAHAQTFNFQTSKVFKTLEVLELRVKDSGIGISARELPHIFDRFYQVDGTITRKGEGTGIGLALTKELVELMGGRITVKSEVDKGTEFYLRLPIRQMAEKKQEKTTNLESPVLQNTFVPEMEALPSPLRGPKHDLPQLLIVEDNADVAHYIRSCVSDRFLVQIATDGREGFRQATEDIPDIIISDVMMPEMDGYELTHALKSDERTSHIPIILLTAKADLDSRIEGLSKGADAYLNKPFDQRELLLRLDKLQEVRRVLQAKYSQGVIEEEKTTKQPTLDELFLQKIYEVIEEKMDDPELSIDHFCKVVHLSYTQVYRKIKALTGQTPTLLIRSQRLQHAKKLLETTNLNVTEVTHEVGFNSVSYFSRAFKQSFGVPPSGVQ